MATKRSRSSRSPSLIKRVVVLEEAVQELKRQVWQPPVYPCVFPEHGPDPVYTDTIGWPLPEPITCHGIGNITIQAAQPGEAPHMGIPAKQ
jgi:hypothetical protein